jgi:hypothetical protein
MERRKTMKTARMSSYLVRVCAVVFLVVIATLLGGAAAQETSSDQPQATQGTGFTYQGRLTDGGGNPITETCDFRFSLWQTESGGSQVGGDCTVAGVDVTDGLFTALVNDSGQFGPTAFLGDERWLQVAVKCGSEPSYTPLSPRQPITAAPYALALWPGSTMLGTNQGDASMLWIGNQATSGRSSALHGESASTEAHAIEGVATASSGPAIGVVGETASPSGVGVWGDASSTSGYAIGVEGYSSAQNGTGTAGVARGSGATMGVYGSADSAAGTGVWGMASASSGGTHGVAGGVWSPGGSGVYGYNEATTGNAVGVAGKTYSPEGYGGYFVNEYGGTAIYALGDVVQDLSTSGLVKAAVYAYCHPTMPGIYRSFNTISGTTTIGGGSPDTMCWLDFNFNLSQRFWVAMAYSSGAGYCRLGAANDLLDCYLFDPAGNYTWGDIMVVVY